MSGRNGSASDADCRISEDCRVPDVELMELGPLLEETGRQTAGKGMMSEVRAGETGYVPYGTLFPTQCSNFDQRPSQK
jgi:hypothetical protein